MDRQPVLVGMTGPNSGRRFMITEVGLVLGRGEGCSVRIEDDNVSREHARVLVYNSGVWVRDTGSRNGVFVNDKRVVRPKQLGPGDMLSIGDHRFSVELQGLEGGDGSPPPEEPAQSSDESSAATGPLTLPPHTRAPAGVPAGRGPIPFILAAVFIALVGAAAWLVLGGTQ